MDGNKLVTAVIPTIPTRKNDLRRAAASVEAQSEQPVGISVATDVWRSGSAATRNRALGRVTTEWSAFLDDDDFWMPSHIQTLLHAATNRLDSEFPDVIYTGCRVVDANGGEIPLQEEWGRFGKPFDPGLLREKSYIPVTSMVRTEMAQAAGFGPPEGVDTPYDDWGFYLRLLDAGAKFLHIPRITWVWVHNGRNTSGQANRW